MLIECFRKYEYFINLKKLAFSAKRFTTFLYYGNIHLVLTTTDKLIFTSPIRGCIFLSSLPYQRVLDFCDPLILWPLCFLV